LEALQELEPPRSVEHPLFVALAPLLRDRFPDAITPETVDQFAGVADTVSPALGSVARGLSRMTMVPSLVYGGTKSNSVPAAARLGGTVRLWPGRGFPAVEDCLGPPPQEGPSPPAQPTAEPSQSAPEEPFLTLLGESAARVLGEPVTLLLSGTTGFTDSHFAR